MNMASTTEVDIKVEDAPNKNADEDVEATEKKEEGKESKGFCGPDMWYSPRGKSIPCIICLILFYIVFSPFILVIIILTFICYKCYMTNPKSF